MGDEATDFDGFFAREIAPWLEEEEQQRRVLAAKVARRWWVTGGVTALICVLMLGFLKISLVFFIFVAAAGFVIGGMLGYPLFVWSDTFNETLAQRVFGHFGYQYQAKLPYAFLEQFERLGILPSFTRHDLSDQVQGRLDNVDFCIGEALLHRRSKNKKSDTETVVFHGLLARVDVAKPFESRTLIVADRGSVRHFVEGIFGNDRHVQLEDPRFEAVFDVTSSDQIEARYLLTPAFMERMLALKARVDGSLCAAFDRGHLWLAVDGGRDYFPKYSMWADARDPDQARKLVRDIELISDMIRLLKLGGETHV